MILQNKGQSLTGFGCTEKETGFICEICVAGEGLGKFTKVQLDRSGDWYKVIVPKELRGLDIPSYALSVTFTKV